MIPNRGKGLQMFNLIVSYLKENGNFDSPFVKEFERVYGVTEKELREWVEANKKGSNMDESFVR